jgi:para-aminobenzoate synthetase/4-amino-4-deoxychorismate lyase
VTATVLIDDNTVGGSALLFEEPSDIICASEIEQVPSALASMQAALEKGAYLAGFFAYELGYAFEARLAPLMPADRRVPLLWFGVFDAPRTLSGGDVGGHLSPTDAPPCQFSDLRFSMDRDAYRERFEQVKNYIAAGDIYQLNLTFKAHFDFTGDARLLFAELREKQPVAYGALIETDDFAVLSISPEVFLQRNGQEISTRPMKGTVARGPTTELDEARQQWLRTDAKSRAENLMIVDLMRNDFGRVAETGSVTVSDLFTVEPYSTLHQMTSGVRARVRADVGLAELVANIFPPGSVTGAPKMRAIEIIRELETNPRGVYTGAVGMVAPDGDASFNVAIRTLTICDGKGEIGIGSGIVQDSSAAAEYDECLLKLRFLSEPAHTFQLIETMRFEPGDGYFLLDRHLDRLAASARYFDYPFDRKAVVAALEGKANAFGQQVQRVRLLLDRDGESSVTAVEIARPTPAAQMTYVVSEHAVRSDDTFLYHKTTRRELYDGEHAALSERFGCDEVVFLNERGELAEGSRTNIFLERNGRLMTPALECGLLPGTLRAELLATGEAHEGVFHLADLETSDRIYLGNSVRGLVEAHALNEPILRAVSGT